MRNQTNINSKDDKHCQEKKGNYFYCLAQLGTPCVVMML